CTRRALCAVPGVQWGKEEKRVAAARLAKQSLKPRVKTLASFILAASILCHAEAVEAASALSQ
ncbi:MAG: hypothetical protein LBU92_00070, partial [Prevotellaceae bacterium]|nr:hypothetical protein [Prevotellaceae bacterium]